MSILNRLRQATRRALPQALLLLFTLVLATGAMPGQARAWWNKDRPYRKLITIDTSSKGVELRQPVGRAPLLIRLHSGNYKFDDSAQDGSDLRFVAGDDKTPLAYHIESFDPLLGVAAVWVDIPQYPVAATKPIWMYYGNKKATPAVDTAATFDPDYVAVYHFDAVASAPPKDKTAYANIAQTAPAGVDDGGVIGKSARFTGAAPMMIGASPSMAIRVGQPFTFSAWVRMDAPQPNAAIYARRDGGASLVVGVDQGAPFAEINGQRIPTAAALVKGQWTHLAFVADGRSGVLYVNGKPAGTGAGALPALNGPTAIGGDAPGGALAGFQGGLDEVRISKVARPAVLIQADAASQGAESRLTAFGADEKQSGFGFGYFGVIFKSVTVDAWVVIAILGVMAVSSWYVMWTKTAYVNIVDGANDRFLELFGQHIDDPLAVAHPDQLDPRDARRVLSSSIYRVYRSGADEVDRRAAKGGRLTLRAESMQVIRALMDATLVRENQKLSKDMVLLTIAISGGPFLGLLGTVVGVMITFAAIAAAGEVNVNAIAPGISAALLATVTGLAVAIPALFGYNYILTRNKAVQANMIVFVDEFVTRVSEIYSDQGYAQAAE
jgi:biopolymer transport protein ExbB